MAELLNEIDVLVHPANQEPLGRVLLEASASAVPIVATNVGGTSEIFVDGVTGMLIPPRDPQALAVAVIELLNNSSKANSVGLAARERMCCDFPVSLAARRLTDLWNQVLDNEDGRC